MQEIQTKLGNRIRKLRTERNYSQESFADVCKIHRTYMGAVERGERNLTLKTLMTVAKALDMTAAELLKGIA